MKTTRLMLVALALWMGQWMSHAASGTAPISGGSGGSGGGGSTNAIPFLDGSGTNTALYNATLYTSTFRSAPRYARTNFTKSTNIVAIWGGFPLTVLQVTNHTTLQVTNQPAAGADSQWMGFEIIHDGGPSNLFWVSVGPIGITWRDGVGPNLNPGRNYVDLWFDGTNIVGFSRQTLTTGETNSAVVLSNRPSITQLRMPGSGAASNYVWACTNTTTGEGEWRARPRVGVYRTLTIGAAAMVTNLTSGSLIKQEETVANFINRYYHEFSGTVTNIATFSLPMPEAWDRGQVEVKVYWSSTNSAANQTNVWGVATSFVDDDDPIDAAYGTEVVTADPVSAPNDLMISSVLTPTPGAAAGAAGAMLDLRLRRLPGHVDDQLGGVSKLYAIVVRYAETTTEPGASW